MHGVGALHQHGPVAVGVVGEDLLGDHVAGHQAGDDAGPGHRARAGGTPAAHPRSGQVHQARRRVLGAGDAEAAGQQPQQLLQIAGQGRVQRHLDPEILGERDAPGPGDAPRSRAHQVLRDTGDVAIAGHRNLGQVGDDLVATAGVGRDPGMVDQVLLHHHRAQGGEAPGIGAGPNLQVEVGQVRRLGAPGVEHDHGPGRIASDLLEGRAGVGETVGLPGVLADEHGDLGLVEVGPHVSAQELAVHEHLTGLLLGQRVRAEGRAQRGAGGAGVGAAEMVPLPAAAVVEDRLAAMLLADRGVPVDLLETAVSAAPQRRGQAVATVLVVVQAQGLLAGVALGGRVGLVASDPFEPAAVVAAQTDLDAAVALAQDAGRRVPGAVVHRSSSQSVHL